MYLREDDSVDSYNIANDLINWFEGRYDIKTESGWTFSGNQRGPWNSDLFAGPLS